MDRSVCCRQAQAVGQLALTFRDANGIKKTTVGMSFILKQGWLEFQLYNIFGID